LGDLSSPSDSTEIIIFLRKFGDENISRKLKYRDQLSPVATSNNVPRLTKMSPSVPLGCTSEIGDGQRIAVLPVGQHELALVVGAPQIIGLITRRIFRCTKPVDPDLRRYYVETARIMTGAIAK
jgi:hypothetical protein